MSSASDSASMSSVPSSRTSAAPTFGFRPIPARTRSVCSRAGLGCVVPIWWGVARAHSPASDAIRRATGLAVTEVGMRAT
nr:hypothetical protein [Haladaptatus sp. R4]